MYNYIKITINRAATNHLQLSTKGTAVSARESVSKSRLRIDDLKASTVGSNLVGGSSIISFIV